MTVMTLFSGNSTPTARRTRSIVIIIVIWPICENKNQKKKLKSEIIFQALSSLK